MKEKDLIRERILSIRIIYLKFRVRVFMFYILQSQFLLFIKTIANLYFCHTIHLQQFNSCTHFCLSFNCCLCFRAARIFSQLESFALFLPFSSVHYFSHQQFFISFLNIIFQLFLLEFFFCSNVINLRFIIRVFSCLNCILFWLS